MRDSEQLRAAIALETAELQMLRATLPMKQLITVIDVVVDAHLADLASIDPERLRFKQGAIRQLQALRAVLLDDNPHLSPKA
jgi:hypothetical protein